FRSIGQDPFLILHPDSFRSDAVQAVRFRMRGQFPRSARAQLFWRHAGDGDFTEDKSITIALDESPDWREYFVDLSNAGGLYAWQAGESVIQLRLDPTDGPGEFELGSLELLQYRL